MCGGCLHDETGNVDSKWCTPQKHLQYSRLELQYASCDIPDSDSLGVAVSTILGLVFWSPSKIMLGIKFGILLSMHAWVIAVSN